jgi:protein-glutamine gamma-glutamyltransferase
MDEPLFRGAVLSRYVPSAQRWESAGFERRIEVHNVPTGDVVRQEFHLEPIETDVLFAMHPVRGCRIYSRRRWLTAFQDQQTGRLFASREHFGGARYNVYSPAARIAGGDLVTGGHSPPRRQDRTATPELGELTKLAREVARYKDTNSHPPDADMARRLLAWLRDSGQFEYSLDTTPVNPASDPIEDFLLRRRSGHCEYFASSLTLMLRAVDVPARLVSGFKGGEPLDGDEGLQVQRRHAHAWVEAWYDGRWHVLDPTPAAGRLASVEEMGPSLGTLGGLWTAVSRWWSEFVVGMDLSQQRRDLYEPLQRGLQDLWKSLQGDRRAGESLLGSIRGFLSSPRRWISWQGGLVTFVLLLVVSGSWWLARRGWRAIRRLWSRMRTAVVHRGRQVEFYERFRRLCERQGLVRRPGQTQREFADHVRGRLQPLLAAAGIGEFPTRLVELFYQVRFGEQPLQPDVSQELDRRLTEMEQCLVQTSTAPSPTSPIGRAALSRQPQQQPSAATNEGVDGLSAGTSHERT